MKAIRRNFAVSAEVLGPRQVKLRASTEALGRDDLVVTTRGIDLGPYQTNPVMLFNHDPSLPVARAAEVAIEGGELRVLAEFAAEGTSAKADEICGLVKQAIISGVSIGFQPLEVEPINPKDRSAGRRVVRCELFEISFVAIPAERNSLVTERADVPQDVTDDAQGVVNTEKPARAEQNEGDRARQSLTIRGLYEVAELAWALSELGWINASAKWEAEIEGDNSPVPAMLAAVLKDLGAALVAMTEEEVAELLAGDADDGVDLSYVMSAAPGAERMKRCIGLLHKRAGKKHSVATLDQMQEVMDHLTRSAEANQNAASAMQAMMDDTGEGSAAADDGAAPRSAEAAFRRRLLEVAARATPPSHWAA